LLSLSHQRGSVDRCSRYVYLTGQGDVYQRPGRGRLVVVTDERSERLADGSQSLSSALCAGGNRTMEEP